MVLSEIVVAEICSQIVLDVVVLFETLAEIDRAFGKV